MEEFKWNLKFPVHLHHNTGEFVQLKKNPSQRFWGKNCPKSIQILLNPKYLNRAWKRGAALGAENSETKERWKSKFLDLKFLTDSLGSWGFWNSFSWSFRAKQSKFFFLIIPNCERENREEESELSPAPQEFPPKAQSSKSRRKSIQNQRNHPKTWTKKNPEFLICYLRSPLQGILSRVSFYVLEHFLSPLFLQDSVNLSEKNHYSSSKSRFTKNCIGKEL